MRRIIMVPFAATLAILTTASAVEPQRVIKQIATELSSPFKGTEWEPNSYKFGQDCSYPKEDGTQRRWGQHLGEDQTADPGRPVYAIADGKISYAKMHPGKSKDARNWGGVVIQGIWVTEGNAFYVLYGHLKLNPELKEGSIAKRGDLLGWVGCKLTPENGWWEESHLHLQIILDPTDVYRGGILMGYAQRTVDGKLVENAAPNRLRDCMSAKELFEKYKNNPAALKDRL